MMPLMIFIYGRFFIDGGAIKIPYLEIAGQLCYIVVPVLIGMFIKWKWRACGTRAARLLQPLAFAFLVTIIGFGTYVNLPIYRLMGEYPLLFPTAAALPWIGFLLSGFFAFICRRTRAEILTIAIETGIQNIGIAMLVLLYSMPQPEGDIGAVMPLVVSLFTPIPLIIAYIGLLIKEGKCTRCCKKPNSREDKASEEQGEPLRPADNDVEVADADVNSDDTRKLSYSKDHIIQTIIS